MRAGEVCPQAPGTRARMHPSDYRRDYAAYRSAVERALYEYRVGLSPRVELRDAEERHAELWTRDAFEELRRAHDETSGTFETERAGLSALACAASLKHAESRAAEVTGELRSCAAAARVSWDGVRLDASEVPEALASESDAGRRRELARRWLDSAAACDDLRAARLESLGEAARGLGFDNRAALYESFSGVSLEALASAADSFLRRTETAYMSRLAEWAARELPVGEGFTPDYADTFLFTSSTRFDERFPARDFRTIYAEALAGLGVRVESQRNLRVEDARPTSARAEQNDARSDVRAADADSACFAVRPPEDVRLVVGSRVGGLDFQRRGLFEGGRAQVFAWASRDTAARHPEFVYAPDGATEAGHALLLSGLLTEPSWLAGRRGMRATEAGEAARAASLLELYEVRRYCARLRHALAVDAAADARSEQVAEEYASRFTEATGFRHHAGSRLREADEWFASATRLRARLFAAGLREHLRSRHGRRWFASRAAGGELIDVWNTASRYSAEELARLLWGGGLSFDLLADASLEGSEGGESV
ncbi:MAG TPA: hypothetical protein VM914_14020 [Pyrinomonadaceae bacterium]|nr:hypothetical protein [Pyrinomonadaceae bacterium]